MNEFSILLAQVDANSIPSLPKEFFTVESLLTLSGASTMTMVASYGLQWVFKKDLRLPALFFAMAISYIGLVATGASLNWLDFVVAFFNGWLILGSAIGLSLMIKSVSEESDVQTSEVDGEPRRRRVQFFPRLW